MSATEHHDDHEHGIAHIATIKTLVATGGTLLLLTLLTVLATRIDFGANINLSIAMVIAVTKATLVVLFFMHLYYSSKLTKVTVVAAIFFLFLLLALSMTAYLTRGWITNPTH